MHLLHVRLAVNEWYQRVAVATWHVIQHPYARKTRANQCTAVPPEHQRSCRVYNCTRGRAGAYMHACRKSAVGCHGISPSSVPLNPLVLHLLCRRAFPLNPVDWDALASPPRDAIQVTHCFTNALIAGCRSVTACLPPLLAISPSSA